MVNLSKLQGHLLFYRAINNNLVDTYQLKSLDGQFGETNKTQMYLSLMWSNVCVASTKKQFGQNFWAYF